MIDYPTKQTVVLRVLEVIEERLIDLEEQVNELKDALVSDTKSSAGDKHETSRAMTQLEQEKLGKQIAELEQLQSNFLRINRDEQHHIIQMGSLIQTSEGLYYLSIPLGKITLTNESQVFCLSPISPLGQLLKGKREGEEITFNNRMIKIEGVY